MGEINDWEARLRKIPVDKGDRNVATPDGVARNQVAVAHNVSRHPWDPTHHPYCVWSGDEALLRVVAFAKQASETLESRIL